MKTYSFRIVVEPDGERWHAFCPALVGRAAPRGAIPNRKLSRTSKKWFRWLWRA
jgi:hypothetical protein